MQIRIYETVDQRPNGDRDPQRHPSSKFEVYLVSGERRTLVFKNDQFDPFYVSIKGTRDQYLSEAMKFARELSQTLGSCEIVGVELTKEEKEIAELEVSIRRDIDRLNKLKKKVL